MKRAAQTVFLTAAVLLIAGLAAPKLNADRYRAAIQNALTKALERQVEIGEIRFNLLTGPGFSVSDVKIGEDPKIGAEPIAYVGTLVAMPRLWSLWTGHLVFSSLRLEDAQLNLSRSQSPSGQYRWNFETLLRPSLVAAFPNLSIRGGRINFKAENLKSVVYLLDSDLDIVPPSSASSPWRVRFEGKPCRTDRPARGSGVFTSRGTWSPSTGKLNLDLVLDRSELGDIMALLRGEDIGLHGFVSGKAHLAGPPEALAINGRLNILDVHGWDQSVPQGETWPLDVSGQWNLPGQQLKIVAGVANKVAVHYLVEKYFTQPKWGVNVSFNDFNVEPLVALSRHLGVVLPDNLKLTGKLDGVLGYSGFLEGQATFRNVALTLPAAQPVHLESAQIVVSQNVARLLPTHAVFANGEEAGLEASYSIGAPAPEFRLSTAGLSVKSIAGIPLLSTLAAGSFRGDLRLAAGLWRGNVELTDAVAAFPGFSEPIAIASANVRLDGARVVIRNLQASAAGISASGDYRYEPAALRPHRFRLATAELDTAALEKLAMPALSRRGGLFGFGSAALPDWLKRFRADGNIQIASLHAGSLDLQDVHSRVQWDGAHIALPDLGAALGQGSLASRVSIDLTGRAPVYQAATQLTGVEWKGGRMDADAQMQTSGLGLEILNHLRSTGSFSGRGVLDDFPAVTGRYDLRWAALTPRLNVTDLRLSGAGEILTGKASLQDDGTLLVQAANGARRMRVPLQ